MTTETPPTAQVLVAPREVFALGRATAAFRRVATDPGDVEHARELETLMYRLVTLLPTIDETHGHTQLDAHALVSLDERPDTVQPREHAVPCAVCQVPTWNLQRYCDLHYKGPNRHLLTGRGA